MKKSLLLLILLLSLVCFMACDSIFADSNGENSKPNGSGAQEESNTGNSLEDQRAETLAMIDEEWNNITNSLFFLDLSQRAQNELTEKKDAIVLSLKSTKKQTDILQAIDDFGALSHSIYENPVSKIELKDSANLEIPIGASIDEWIRDNIFGKTLTVKRINTGTDNYSLASENIAFINGNTYDIGYIEIAVGVPSAEGDGAYVAIISVYVAIVPDMTGAEVIGTLSLPTNDITKKKELVAYDNEYGTLDGEYCRVIYAPDYISVLTAKGYELFITDKGNGVGAYYNPKLSESPTFVYTYTYENDNLIFEIYGTITEGISTYITVVRDASAQNSEPLITSYGALNADMTMLAFHVMQGAEFVIQDDGTLIKAN